MPRGNTSDRRGRGFAPSRVLLPASVGEGFRALAAALEILEPTAAGEEVGDGEELARRLAEAYRLRPVETITALSPLVTKKEN